jgi:hypothetical protein
MPKVPVSSHLHQCWFSVLMVTIIISEEVWSNILFWFAFSLIVMFGIFLHVFFFFWPFVCLLWRNFYSSPLLIFNQLFL